jgi:transcription initiation factor TFIID subunit TAF12
MSDQTSQEIVDAIKASRSARKLAERAAKQERVARAAQQKQDRVERRTELAHMPTQTSLDKWVKAGALKQNGGCVCNELTPRHNTCHICKWCIYCRIYHESWCDNF